MRIVLTCNYSPWSSYSGGGQRSTHQLATALVALGHDVTVVYTAPVWNQPTPTEETSYAIEWAVFFGVRARRSSPLRPLNALSVRGVLEQLHRRLSVDVVHSQGEEGALLGTWARKNGVVFVITPRFPKYPDNLAPDMPISERMWLWLRHTKYVSIGKSLDAAQRICPTSAVAKERIQHAFGTPDDRFQVVPNGVHSAFLETDWRPKNEGPVLFFGRLEDDKGVDLVLQALAPLECALRIVGRGDQEELLRQRVADWGMEERVTWDSWLTPIQLAEAIGQSALAVLPSRHESFGNAMVEVMAVGAPLITTQAGSIPEVVGDGAILVPSEDVEALREAIVRLLEDDAEAGEMGAKGKAHVRGRYQWIRVAESFVEVYQDARNELMSSLL